MLEITLETLSCSCPSFVKFELGFCCLTSRASRLWRPEKSRVRPSPSSDGVHRPYTFDKFKNRTENTKNGVVRPRTGTTRDAGF